VAVIPEEVTAIAEGRAEARQRAVLGAIRAGADLAGLPFAGLPGLRLTLLLARFLARLPARLQALRLTSLLTRLITFLLARLLTLLLTAHPAFHFLAQALGLRQRLFERLAVLIAGSLLAVTHRLLNFA
jgi:hypothetical protein